jgi:hypothetical protein
MSNNFVSIVTGFVVDDLGSIIGSARDFSLRYHIQTGCEAHIALCPMDYGTKAVPLELDQSTPSGAEIKNAWSYTYTPHTSSRRRI